MSGAPPALALTGIRKRFGETIALDGIDLAVRDRELVALVGPSGCGKSTLLRVVAGLVPADEGRVELGGVVVGDRHTHLPPERRGVGLVFQEHALFPHLTVGQNVAFGLRRLGRAQRSRRVEEILGVVGLGGHRDRYPHELSGGERQRVALARALAPGPSVLLLDEPFASLDPNLRARIRTDVVAILRQAGTAAVFVTHEQTEAMAIGDRVAVLDRGRLHQVDTPWAVFHRPADRFVASFMGEADFLAARIEGGHLLTELGASPAPEAVLSAGATVMVRPDDVTFEVDATADAEVVAVEFRGSSFTYVIRLASGATARSTRSHLVHVEPGTRVRAALVPGHRPVPISGAGSEPPTP